MRHQSWQFHAPAVNICMRWSNFASPAFSQRREKTKFKKPMRADFSWLGNLCHALLGLVWPVAETHVSHALPNALAHSVSTMLSKWARVWRTNCHTRAPCVLIRGARSLAFFLSLPFGALATAGVCAPCEFARFAGDSRARPTPHA